MLRPLLPADLLQFNKDTGFLEFKVGEEPVLVALASTAIMADKKEDPTHKILAYEEPPAVFPFDPYEAYKIRLVNFANGAIYAIKYDSTLTDKEKASRRQEILTLLNNKIKRVNNFKETMGGSINVSFSSELYQFYNKDLPKASGLKAKDIALGEALYVWQEIPRPTRETIFRRMIDDEDPSQGYLEITQIDEPRVSALTKKQKEELRKLVTSVAVKPQWFNDLPSFAQNSLITLLSPITEEHKEKFDLRKIFNEQEVNQPEWFKQLPPRAQNALKRICIHAFPGTETDLYRITDKENEDLQKIFDEQNRPDWFNKLSPLSQEALLTLLGSDCNWANYQKCHPTILREIPGEANATTHKSRVVHVSNDGTRTILSETIAVRQGAPTSFDMKNKLERQTSAEENLKQMLSTEAITVARNAFKDAWEIKDAQDVDFPLPILLGGLLTSSEQANYKGKFVDVTGLSAGSNNTLMAREKSAAIEAWKNENKNTIQNVELFDINIGVNNHRSGVVKRNEGFYQFTRFFYKKIRDRKNSNNKEKLALLKSAKQALKALDGKKSKHKGRNENLYTAALYDATTRLMYGYDTGNCKSSKDRKGVEFLMADAMLVYLARQQALGIENPVFPGINDTGEDRKRFVKIFCELYASGHQLLVAHDNSPGSPGIKDEGILDKDIIKELQSMRQEKVKKSFLEKHGSKIFIAASAIVLGVVAGALIATGVLAPLGIAAGAIATELGISVIAGTAVGAGIATAMIQVGKKDYSGVYGQSKQLADSNKPGSFWKKHRNKVFKGLFALVVVGLLVGVTAALIASGILAPIGIITAAIAVKIAIGAAAVPAAAITLVTLRQIKEVRTDNQNSFSAQEENFAKKGKEQKSAAQLPEAAQSPDVERKRPVSADPVNDSRYTPPDISVDEKVSALPSPNERDKKIEQQIRNIINNICDQYFDRQGEYRKELRELNGFKDKNKNEFIREKIREQVSSASEKKSNQSLLFQPVRLNDIDKINLDKINEMISRVLLDKYSHNIQTILAEMPSKANRPGSS